MKPGDPGSPEWLALHAIDPDVWAERGAWRFETGDEEAVIAAMRPFLRPSRGKNPQQSINGQIQWLRRIVAQSGGGLVMPKTAPPGWETQRSLGPVPSQLRPDKKVLTSAIPDPDNPGSFRPSWGPYHYHGDELEDDDPWPLTPNGKGLIRKSVWGKDNIYVQRHIAKSHGGVNTNEVHRHREEPVKYLFMSESDEARIDLHPRAARLLPDADRVFLVLEGVLKNDSILSAGEAVFSVPSVTLWKPEELRRFAEEHLRGKMIFVVPDGDWFDKEMVDWQALLVRTYLRETLGHNRVYIAAPPVEFYEYHRGLGDDTQKGVDDWLGTKGQEYARSHMISPGIDGLIIRGKEPGPEVLRSWPTWDFRESDWTRRGPRLLYDEKDYHALTLLSLLATDPEDEAQPKADRAYHYRSLSGLASIMDVSGDGNAQRIVRFLERLHDWRAITVTGSLQTARHPFHYRETIQTRKDGKTAYQKGPQKTMTVNDWKDRKDRPMIEMRDGFQAYETPQVTLGDFWEQDNRAMIRELKAEADENARRLREIEERLDQDTGRRRLRRVR